MLVWQIKVEVCHFKINLNNNKCIFFYLNRHFKASFQYVKKKIIAYEDAYIGYFFGSSN